MMLERFGNHLQQHLRTHKTHFSNLHWGMFKCWCSAVQSARCQPTSQKCWVFMYHFCIVKKTLSKCLDVRGRPCTNLRVVAWGQEDLLGYKVLPLIVTPPLLWGNWESALRNHLCRCVSRGAEQQLYLSVQNNPLSVFLHRNNCSFQCSRPYDKPVCIAIRSEQVKVRKQIAGCVWDETALLRVCARENMRNYSKTARHCALFVCEREMALAAKMYFWNSLLMSPILSVTLCKTRVVWLCRGWCTTPPQPFDLGWKWENKQYF